MDIHPKDLKTAENRIPAQELLPNVPRIAVHLGAATPSKRWGAESFATLLYEIHAQTQAELYLLGGEQDMAFVHEVLDGLRCPVVNLVGKFSLLEIGAFTRDCQLFIGCDSGTTHLAAAAGVPVICLFSAANEVDVWKPVGSKVKVLTRHPECSPCAVMNVSVPMGIFVWMKLKWKMWWKK